MGQRIPFSVFAGGGTTVAGAVAQITSTGDPTSPTPTVSIRVTNPNGGTVADVVVPVYVDGQLDGQAKTDANGLASYTLQASLSGSDLNPVSHTISLQPTLKVLSASASLTVKVPSVAPTAVIFRDTDFVEEGGSPAGTYFARLQAVDPNVGDTFTWALSNTAGGRVTIETATGKLFTTAIPFTFAGAPFLADGYQRGHTIAGTVTDADGHVLPFTQTVRVFPNLTTYLTTAPAELDPSTLPGVLLDINPIASKVNGGTAVDGAAISAFASNDAGAYPFLEGTVARQPTWVADCGNGKPGIAFANGKRLTCLAPALATGLDGNYQPFTVIAIYDNTAAGSGDIISFGGPTVPFSRMSFNAGSSDAPIVTVNDYPIHGPSESKLAALPAGSTPGLSTPYCVFAGAASRESLYLQRDYNKVNRNAVWAGQSQKLFFKTPTVATSVVTLGGLRNLELKGRLQRLVIILRPLMDHEMYGISLWAKNRYGTATPDWSRDLDLGVGYVQDDGDDYTYSSFDEVQWGNPRVEAQDGVISYNNPAYVPPDGPFAGRAVSSVGSNPSEGVALLNMSGETPELRDYGVMDFKNSHVVMAQRPIPNALKPYGNLNNETKDYISAQLMGRYATKKHIYGIWHYKGVMGDGGAGMWIAYWLYCAQAGTIGELDGNESFGSDPWCVHVTTHDAATGGVGNFYFVGDQRAMSFLWSVEITPTTITFYCNLRKLYSYPTAGQLHQLKYFWIDNVNGGKISGGFPGLMDETSKVPNWLATDYWRHYRPVDSYLQLTGTAVTNAANAITAAMQSKSGSAPPAATAAAVAKLVGRMMGSTALYIDGTQKSVWDLRDWILIPAAYAEGAGMVDWKTPSRSITKVGTPDFTPYAGLKSGTVGSYWDTGIVLGSTAGLTLTADSTCLDVWTLDQPAGTGDMFVAGTPAWNITPAVTDTYCRTGGTQMRVYKGAKSAGLHAISKLTRDGTGFNLVPFFNGTPWKGFMATGVSVSANFDTDTVKIGATSAANYGSQRVAEHSGGPYMTEAHHRMWQAMLQEYLQAIGAINAPLTINAPSPVPTATQGVAYSYAPVIFGGTAPRTVAVSTANGQTGLPAGLSLNTATGEISGTTTAAVGNYTARLTVTDAAGATAVLDIAFTLAAVALGTLRLSGLLTNGLATTGLIDGATGGSALTSNLSGLTVNSAQRTYAWDGTGAAGATANALVETLSGSSKNNAATVLAAQTGTLKISGRQFFVDAASMFMILAGYASTDTLAATSSDGTVLTVGTNSQGYPLVVGTFTATGTPTITIVGTRSDGSTYTSTAQVQISAAPAVPSTAVAKTQAAKLKAAQNSRVALAVGPNPPTITLNTGNSLVNGRTQAQTGSMATAAVPDGASGTAGTATATAAAGAFIYADTTNGPAGMAYGPGMSKRFVFTGTVGTRFDFKLNYPGTVPFGVNEIHVLYTEDADTANPTWYAFADANVLFRQGVYYYDVLFPSAPARAGSRAVEIILGPGLVMTGFNFEAGATIAAYDDGKPRSAWWNDSYEYGGNITLTPRLPQSGGKVVMDAFGTRNAVNFGHRTNAWSRLGGTTGVHAYVADRIGSNPWGLDEATRFGALDVMGGHMSINDNVITGYTAAQTSGLKFSNPGNNFVPGSQTFTNFLTMAFRRMRKAQPRAAICIDIGMHGPDATPGAANLTCIRGAFSTVFDADPLAILCDLEAGTYRWMGQSFPIPGLSGALVPTGAIGSSPFFPPQNCAFTGSISGNVLTVTAVASGRLEPGMASGTNGVFDDTTNGTFIRANGTGTGGTGTYILAYASGDKASASMNYTGDSAHPNDAGYQRWGVERGKALIFLADKVAAL